MRRSPFFRQARRVISRHPSLFFATAGLLGNKQLLDASTDLVSEGYPRSANTYFEAALLVSQDNTIHVSSHSHASAQVLMGIRKSIPTIVLFRNPKEAVASLLELTSGDLPVEEYIKDYYTFYEDLKGHLDRVMLVEFPEAIGEFSVVISRINARFGLDYKSPEDMETFKVAVREKMDELGLKRAGWAIKYGPSVSEEEKQQRLARKKECSELVLKPEYAAAMNRCQLIYEKMCEARAAQ